MFEHRPWGLIALLVVGVLGCGDGGGAARPDLEEYNLDGNGLALKGYSPVSYVDGHVARPGESGIAHTYRGITYRFTSQDELSRFRADPERYEPACGGWCAYGSSVGIRWDVVPESFEIIRGRLFLFSRNNDIDARELWKKEDQAALVDRANKYWESKLRP